MNTSTYIKQVISHVVWKGRQDFESLLTQIRQLQMQMPAVWTVRVFENEQCRGPLKYYFISKYFSSFSFGMILQNGHIGFATLE